MYSSVKFLSPIVTGGLPRPGPFAAAGGFAPTAATLAELVGVVAVGLAPVADPVEELPHAASTTVAATATAATPPRLRYVRLRFIDSSWLVVRFLCDLGDGRKRRR